MRSKIKRGPGAKGKHLAQSVQIALQTGKKTGTVNAWVIAKAPHASLVEKGHKGVRAGSKAVTFKTGQEVRATGKKALNIRLPGGGSVYRVSTRAVPPHPFAAPAAQEGAAKCVSEIARTWLGRQAGSSPASPSTTSYR